MTIVVAALRLRDADLGEFRVGVHGLIAARAEENFRSLRQFVREHQAERYGSAVLTEREQARGRTGRGIKFRRMREGRCNRAVGNAPVAVFQNGLGFRDGLRLGGQYGRGKIILRVPAIVRGIDVNGDADLPEVGNARGFPGGIFGSGQRRQQQGREDRDDGDDDEEFNQRETARPRRERAHSTRSPLMISLRLKHRTRNLGRRARLVKTIPQIRAGDVGENAEAGPTRNGRGDIR